MSMTVEISTGACFNHVCRMVNYRFMTFLRYRVADGRNSTIQTNVVAQIRA